MLTRGNRKLGRAGRIWGFALPSRATCPGRSAACSADYYSARLEAFRSAVRRRYRRNLALTRRPDFAALVVRSLTARATAVVRLHVGGDLYDAAYARKWLSAMRRLPGTRFYLYTRSWRVPAVRRVLTRMAALAHIRVWFSCDRETGVPARVPRRVRVAWLQVGPDDGPPRADLVFRVHRLRGRQRAWVPTDDGRRVPVCPAERGAAGGRVTCEVCGVCWRPLPGDGGRGRLPLPVVAAGVRVAS